MIIAYRYKTIKKEENKQQKTEMTITAHGRFYEKENSSGSISNGNGSSIFGRLRSSRGKYGGYTRGEQLNLMLTSGEKLDLFPVMPWELSLSSLANNEQLVAMDDLLAGYGTGTLGSISESDWSCAKVNGQILELNGAEPYLPEFYGRRV